MFGYIAGVALHSISDGSSNGCRARGHFTFDYKDLPNGNFTQDDYILQRNTTQGIYAYDGHGVLPPHVAGATNIQLINVNNTGDLLSTNCVSILFSQVLTTGHCCV